MDLLLEIFYPKSAVGKTYPENSCWLQRLNRKPKHQEQSAKSQASDFSLHAFLCSLHSSLDT
jgi:hypothetical protein